MNPNDLQPTTPWHLAERAEAMNPSAIREILKVTERPGILNFAGGLPSPETFPVDAMRDACATVLGKDSAIAKPSLQYASSEGLPELRQWVADEMGKHGATVSPEQVLITTGSQQGLDLIAKVLLDKGCRLLVESPTYLGALQAFTPMQPVPENVASDDGGVSPQALREALQKGERPRFIYLLPNFQNPTGRTMDETRRQQVIAVCREFGLPIVEEIYADRAYLDDGNLVPRSQPGAMIHGAQASLAHVMRMVEENALISLSGKRIPANPQSICVHGDGAEAVATAKALREGLQNAGYTLVSLPELAQNGR